MITEHLSNTHFMTNLNWLLNSGIQDKSYLNRGGVYAWYDINKKDYAYLYPEIAGYYLHHLSNLLNEESIGQRKIDIFSSAEQAANWLVKIFTSRETIYTKFHPCGKMDKNIFSFDLGVVLNGLNNFYPFYPDEDIKKAMMLIHEMLSESFQSFPVAVLYSCPNTSLSESWSTFSGGHLLKTLATMKKVSLKYNWPTSNIDSCIKNILSQISNDQTFNFDRNHQYTHYHAHLYAIEGLVMLEHPDYYDQAKQLFFNYLEELSNLKSITLRSKWNGIIRTSIRTDIVAQTLRLCLIFKNTENGECIQKFESLLLEFFINSDDEKSHGGLLFGYTSDGQKNFHANTWCSLFLSQYLFMKMKPELTPEEKVKILF